MNNPNINITLTDMDDELANRPHVITAITDQILYDSHGNPLHISTHHIDKTEQTYNIVDSHIDNMPDTQAAASVDSFTKSKYNKKFYISALISICNIALGAAMVWTSPFSGSTVVGVSLITASGSYWMSPPNEHKNDA